MAENSSWYSTGFDGVDKEKLRREALVKPRRFWLKPGATTQIVLVDDEPFNIYEYNWSANGTFMNWATMPEDPDANDVFREKGFNPYFVGMLTVINCTEWEDKRGKKHNFTLELLPAKEKTVELLRERRASRGSLAGKVFKVKRFEGEKTVSVGDDWEYIKDADMVKLYDLAMFLGDKYSDLVTKANTDPAALDYLKTKFDLAIDAGKVQPAISKFNYRELLRPPTRREAQALMAGVTGRRGRSGDDRPKEDEVPF